MLAAPIRDSGDSDSLDGSPPGYLHRAIASATILPRLRAVIVNNRQRATLPPLHPISFNLVMECGWNSAASDVNDFCTEDSDYQSDYGEDSENEGSCPPSEEFVEDEDCCSDVTSLSSKHPSSEDFFTDNEDKEDFEVDPYDISDTFLVLRTTS